ncbi:MAG: AI-2E family transporter [Ignavibacteriae bacterium]|nr:MAG: AI-2E family transporter [Ignavibacteriota bacterium]
MPEKNNRSPETNVLVLAAALVIIIWGVVQAQSFIVLLLVALFLAVIGAPPVLWLKEKRIPSVLAVLTVLACMIIFLMMVGGLVVTSLAHFTDSVPFYQQRIQEELNALKGFLGEKGFVIKENSVLEYVNLGSVMSLTAGLLSGFTSTLSSLFLILLTVTFILLEVSSFPVKLRAIIDNPKAEFSQFRKFIGNINRYLFIKTGISVLTGILVGFWMTFLGVDFPVLWGFLAFLLNYVPSLGVVIAAVPAVLLTLIQLGPSYALLAALGYVLVNFIVGTVVEPKLVGRGVGLSTLVVFLSLIFWGNLLGIIGMVLCIPFTMTLKFALENNEHTRWLAVLLGPETPAPIEPSPLKKNTSKK